MGWRSLGLPLLLTHRVSGSSRYPYPVSFPCSSSRVLSRQLLSFLLEEGEKHCSPGSSSGWEGEEGLGGRSLGSRGSQPVLEAPLWAVQKPKFCVNHPTPLTPGHTGSKVQGVCFGMTCVCVQKSLEESFLC